MQAGTAQTQAAENDHPVLSVVIPVFNEEEVITTLHERLLSALAEVEDSREIIFVNDGSSDGTASVLNELADANSEVKIIHLSRNFGHQPALSAGIDHASGDAIILMDGDLQDRPEAIPLFVKKWKEGHDVVYAVRTSRRESLPMRTAFKLFYKIQHKLSGIDQPVDAGIFGLLDRRVVSVIQSMPERNRYFPGLRAYAGFKQTGIPVERDARYAHHSRVSVSGLTKLAIDGIVSFSYVPIRLITLTGVIVAISSFAYVIRVLYKKLVSGEAILGWASTLTAILFLGAIQLITLGVLGEYIGRIYEEVKQRPFYVVGEKRNFGR